MIKLSILSLRNTIKERNRKNTYLYSYAPFYTMAHIVNPLLSIKVLLKAACSQSEGLYATLRGTFIDKRGFRIWAYMWYLSFLKRTFLIY